MAGIRSSLIGGSLIAALLAVGIWAVLDGILREEETHLGMVDQHNALLVSPREGLSPEAGGMLDTLEKLTVEDYAFPAELAVRQIVTMTGRYAEPERYRAEIAASTVSH